MIDADLLAAIRQTVYEAVDAAMARHGSTHHPAPDRASAALLVALEAFFGEGRFTVAGLLGIAADDPHSDLGAALADLVDLNASERSVATQLGRLLARLPDIEVVAAARGAAVYRLRT